MMSRVEGWESRMQALVEAARTREYLIGQHDCFLFVLNVVKSNTGIDYGAQLGIGPGAYSTELESYRLMRRIAGVHGRPDWGPLDAAVTAALGEPVPMALVHRGDPVLYEDGAGPHLGVCLGGSLAVLAAAGLIFPSRSAGTHGWRT